MSARLLDSEEVAALQAMKSVVDRVLENRYVSAGCEVELRYAAGLLQTVSLLPATDLRGSPHASVVRTPLSVQAE